MKARFQVLEFGIGKSYNVKKAIKRVIKKVTKKRFKKNMKIDYEENL